MQSINPGKQRRDLFNAPLHKKRKWIAAHLEENLLLKYDKRALPVIKGDTIRVMRGSFRGHEDKVVKINVKKHSLEIEGITMSKADGNKIAKPVHPSNVLITKLNLTDKWRRKKLERGLSEETKKDIEREAEEQIKELEDEMKKLEEERALKEAEEEGEPAVEPEEEKVSKKEEKTPVKKTPKKEVKKPIDKPKKATKPKKEEKPKIAKDKKSETKQKSESKKQTEKKTTSTKKKTAKKKGGPR